MQRPSPRFRSEEYFVYKISEADPKKCFNQICRDLYLASHTGVFMGARLLSLPCGEG